MCKKFQLLYNERKRNGYTLEQIAKMINISMSAYFDKEKGTRDFTYTEMRLLSNVFDQSLDYLFQEEARNA
ncbi:helix-turn-helix transcriptional regulator [Staphylococcus saprophyticus]|nr:helix-turn-helix transcriptional regulator [Staphylococcus saprophyticus]